jgi:ribosomal protein S20
LAEKSASKNAQKAVDDMQSEAARLYQAESAIKTMLKRVKDETGEVEKAVEDLKKAEAEIDKDLILKLKRGGLPKQAALVGFLLFSVRSIADTVVSFNDETHLPVALIQGGIALVCAAYVFLV